MAQNQEVDVPSLNYFSTAQTLKMWAREHSFMIVIPFYLQLVNYIQPAISTWESNIGTLSNWLCCHREIAQLLVGGDDLCKKWVRGQEALKTVCVKNKASRVSVQYWKWATFVLTLTLCCIENCNTENMAITKYFFASSLARNCSELGFGLFFLKTIVAWGKSLTDASRKEED